MNFIKKNILKAIMKIDEHTALIVSAAQLHQKTFLPYKNYCHGERDVVVCGAGPSLQKYQPIEGAVHIAVNRSFLYEKVDFDFIFAQDYDGIRMCQNELVQYRPGKCVKMLGAKHNIDAKTIPESLAIKCNALRFYMDYQIYLDGYGSKLVRDIELRPIGGMPNVGMSVMQLALYMNPRRLFIVGCDMSGTHFVPGHQTKEELAAEKKQYDAYWKDGNQKLLDKWKEIKEFAQAYYPETEIISVNPVGLKGMFHDIYQE
ncbi:hypothetical protein [Lacrimispora sp. 210928-DFI.3.58]|uniref:hypothetical protein n=1 Tax=Lacrimispora sp. 210928-DFI.3.58 TaxID=2883214 RepID=UPI001D0894E3|nr:hypothetical protein [Lacrimispora sp. 210928-DFI.3.58]MCB7320969.1 hypothetical protein [Lacrimispora sp. 210928-DFI.3.58]